jgi:hypothetical protein
MIIKWLWDKVDSGIKDVAMSTRYLYNDLSDAMPLCHRMQSQTANHCA